MTDSEGVPQAPAAEIEDFIRQCDDGLRHQVSGDSDPFLALWSHAEDVAILGAIGSRARGWEDVRSHILYAGRRLDWTSVSVERIAVIVDRDLALSVSLERMTREVNRTTEARTLRVTHAYRREHGRWRLILRHANQVTPEDEDREREILGHEPG